MSKNYIYLILFWCAYANAFIQTPEIIKDDVDFWAKVYREWDTHQVVFYDSKTKVVYYVLNLPILSNEISSVKYRKDIEKTYNNIAQALKNIETPNELNDNFAKDIIKLAKKNALDGPDLVDRLKNQTGLRSRFEYGLKISGRYIEDMKAILRWKGLPEELLAIAWVESLFYISAVSHAGATGPLGLLKETAKSHGIHVNNFTDERLDPVMATIAAAAYLQKAKTILKEWPLAITAYNYGLSGMMRAVKNLGTHDYATIFSKHESPTFKYASKSYLAEVLAAIDTIQNQEKYFVDVKKEPAWKYELVTVKRPVEVPDLMAVNAVNKDELLVLNPSLTKRTLSGLEVMPSDFSFRVPINKSKQFYNNIKKIPEKKRTSALSKVSTRFKAKGERLYDIAKMFGISGELLSARFNKPLNYRPKGTVIIRSDAHLVSPLEDIHKVIVVEQAKTSSNERPEFTP